MALAAYATEYGDVQQLTTTQLELVGKVVEVLGCVEEITTSISTEAASMSLIIPFVQDFRLTLEKHDDGDRGIRTTKADMLASLNRRYGNIETNATLMVAMLLDPRFKDKFFSRSDTKIKSLEALNSKLSEMNTDEDGVRLVPFPKRSRQSEISESIWNCFNEIIEKSGACVLGDTGDTEIEQYLKEPLIPFHHANLYLWWKENRHRFVQVSRLARGYL